MEYCLTKVGGKETLGKILKYSEFRKSYLVEFKRLNTVQWIPENLVEVIKKTGGN